MLKPLALFTVSVAAILLLSANPFGSSLQNSSTGIRGGSLLTPGGATAVLPLAAVPGSGPLGAAAAASSRTSVSSTANIRVANLTEAKALPYQFWGVNVVATDAFDSADAAQISATPATFLRFPGGGLGDEFNYTSGVVTNPSGTTYTANTSTQAFISACQKIHCHAILQLPAEINEPQTAAYYASYVVNTLRFQPSFWEIGNSPPSWTHFGVPWSNWATQTGPTLTPLLFAQLVGKYITAIQTVDPRGHFIAFGAAAGSYIKPWVTELASLDGPNLTGIAIHSYIFGTAPVNPTWAQLLANLNGPYALATQVTATRGYIEAACPSCSTRVFVTEANVAEVNNYSGLDPSFAGTLYIAADLVQALQVRLTNLDWFCFECNFSGTWINQTHHVEEQYTLASKMMTHMGNETLPTTVSGPSTFYATATYGSSGLVLLMVNVNLTTSVSVNLAHTGILSGSPALRVRWTNGSNNPGSTNVTLGSTVTVPALSIEMLVVGPGGLAKGYAPAPSPSREGPSVFPTRSVSPFASIQFQERLLRKSTAPGSGSG